MASTKTDKKILCFAPRTNDLKEFEALAREAKGVGFTHVFISDLADKATYWGAEKDSPWCEWSAVIPCVFKHVTVPGLEDAYPAAWVKRQMAYMKAKHKIAAKLGLRGAYYGLEPHFFPEPVYKKHPQWRGSRADNSLRATGMYFAPNTNHPEVLAAYRAGFKKLAQECPLLDVFHLHTNDCGAFYPWGKRLFNGPNGPTGCERPDMGKQVLTFLRTLRQGSADGGVDAQIFGSVYGWFNDDETHLVLRDLEPGIGLIGLAPEPHRAACSILSSGTWGGHPIFRPFPTIDCLPTPGAVLAGAAAIQTSPARYFQSGGNAPEFFEAFKIARDLTPPTTEKRRMDGMVHLASSLYGDTVAEDVVDAWYTLERAETMMNSGMVDLTGGPVMLRWLTRPLVAHQDMLTDDEINYWAPYLYQSKGAQPDDWLNYLNIEGPRMVETWNEASHTCCAIDGVEATLADAAARLEGASKRATRRGAGARLLADAFRVRAQRSMALTVRHYLQVATLSMLRDAENAVAPKTTTIGQALPRMPKGDLGSQGLWYMYRALRWELDNTVELLDLMKRSPVPLFHTAPHPSFAGPFYLEPNVEKNIQRKLDITLKYWRSAEKGYYKPTLGG
ncbi:MAG: hypothetical protein K8T26_17730 [Lentisphaerae bacterium]|nr:hypothetical protein [Lentisphaerota bacterium]